jgi:hypothetical protein
MGGSSTSGGASGKGGSGVGGSSGTNATGGAAGQAGSGGAAGSGGTDVDASGGAGGSAGTDVDAGNEAGDEPPIVCPPMGIEGTGRGLKAEYFADQNLTSLKVTRVDPMIDFDWGSRAPDVGVPEDHFSVRWTGQIQPRYSGTYTFYTTSDDGIRLWVDNKSVIDDWTDHGATEDMGTIDLVGGQKYDLKVEFYDGVVNALARFWWSSDCQFREIVPTSQLYFTEPVCMPASIGSGDGVKGEYYDNADLSDLKLTRTDSTIAFDWGDGTSPDPAVAAGTYSVRWTGQVQAKYTDNITFYTVTDDGVRLIVDDKVLIDNWTDHGVTEDAATIPLTAGQKYNLRLEFYNNGGSANARLSWGSQCQTKEIIPATQLMTTYTGLACAAPVTGTGTGLKGEYFDAIDFTDPKLIRLSDNVNFDFGPNSPDPSIGADTFSIRWTGQVMPRFTGPLDFHTFSDDGVRLWVNGQLIIDDWVDHGVQEDTGTVTVVAGQKYDLRLDYKENGGDALVKLLWSGACQPREIVPLSQLFNTGFTGPLPDAGAPPNDASAE